MVESIKSFVSKTLHFQISTEVVTVFNEWAIASCSWGTVYAVGMLHNLCKSPSISLGNTLHSMLTNCFVRSWFCAVHGPKPLLHRHNWLSFGNFQDTERFLIHCARHFSSRLPPSGGTCKYAKAASTKKITLIDSVPIDMLLSALSFLVVAQSSSEVPEGLMNNPVYLY